MSWKEKMVYSMPKIGDRYINNPNSDKSAWSVDTPKDDVVFTLEPAHEGCGDCEYRLGSHHMCTAFLKEHFIKV